jgi:hypothetical protein
MINDSKYVSHHVIHADIARVYKSKSIDINDIMEWCAQVDTRYITDVDKMVLYLQVPLTVDTDNHQALLPCNVFRILDVYDDDDEIVSFYNNGTYIILPEDYVDESVYINYVGTAIADNGEPLIIKGHENACETFCKLRLFEEDMTLGRFPAQIWIMWDNQFSGQCSASMNDFRHFSREYFNKLNVIQGNMIPKIGQLPLYHKNFSDE